MDLPIWTIVLIVEFIFVVHRIESFIPQKDSADF